MIYILFYSLWYFLPAGLANSAPTIAKKIPFFKNFSYPLDFNKSIGKVRVFGDHKTLRGLLSGIAVAILVVLLQVFLYRTSSFFRSVSLINYDFINPFILGFLFGFGALMGDAFKSFFKRRFSISSGESWFFFDQIDYIIGGLIAVSFYAPIGFIYYITIFLVWFFLHIGGSLLGFFLRLKDTPL